MMVNIGGRSSKRDTEVCEIEAEALSFPMEQPFEYSVSRACRYLLLKRKAVTGKILVRSFPSRTLKV